LTVVITKEYHSYQLHTKCYPTFFSQVNSSHRQKLLRIISVKCDIINQMLTIY